MVAGQFAMGCAGLLPGRRRSGISLLDFPRCFRALVFARASPVGCCMQRYAELQVSSNFSFLRGASHPKELVSTATAHGCYAVALTDRNTLSGIVLAHTTLKKIEQCDTRFVVGCRLDL